MGWYAKALREKLIAAGGPHGITPYGTETMHVLCAEKGYPITPWSICGSIRPVRRGRGGRGPGVDALPASPSTVITGADTAVIWFGADECLVISGGRAAEALESHLRGAVIEHGGAVDVSAQRTTLRLGGAHASDVIAKGCSIDVHPKVFGPGAAAQTTLGQAAVVLIALSDDGTDYRTWFDRLLRVISPNG